MTESERRARFLLINTPQIGVRTFNGLLELFGDARTALRELPDFYASKNRKIPLVPAPDLFEKENKRLEKFGARAIIIGDREYPASLADAFDAPPVLYVMGNHAILNDPAAVAIVGARNASQSGRKIAHDLAYDLAERNHTVISGLARGIDASAHTGALESFKKNGTGSTVAVLAGGLDNPYPPENLDLYRRIADHGCVVSEMPLGCAPQARHFPKRNRIIAGLSQGIVIIEARKKSGTLITSDTGLEYNRTIFAVPGCPLDPRARGGNDLLRQGAILVEDVRDVLENLDVKSAHIAPSKPTPRDLFSHSPVKSPPKKETVASPLNRITNLLSTTPVRLEELARLCDMPAEKLMIHLTELSLDDIVEILPQGTVRLTPRGLEG